MNNDFTRIAVVLDRSGSMRKLRAATVSGFNEYIGTLRLQGGKIKLLLARFDDRYEIDFDKDLADVPELSKADLVPRGRTALFDALGRTVVALGRELNAMAEADRPGKVIVMTMTDGLENASVEYDETQIAAMIKRQRKKYAWEFLYFGTNQDAIEVAANLNIPHGSAMSYSNDAIAMASVMKSAAVATNAYRSFTATGERLKSYEFPVAAREEAMTKP
jgi:hypothetical protein